MAGLAVLAGGGATAQLVTVQPGVQLRMEGNTKGDFYTVFPNINVLDYYRDRKLWNDILAAEDDEDTLRVDRLLSLYVRNFGIQNFREDQDLDLVWKLGQLKMARRDTAKAIYYFGLALKNQAPTNKQIRLFYDTLRAPRANPWVDLDVYYQMVAKRRKIDTLIPPKGVLLTMGPKINSPAPDYGPYMHPSGSVLLFTSRRRDWDAITPSFEQNEDIYFAQTSLFGEGWEPAQAFQSEVNSRFNEGSACLNPEATELYFTRCNAPDGLGVCDLYMADWQDGQWANVRNLGPDVNSTDWDSHPALSPDGKTLFFASNRSGGFGRTDLWMARRRQDGTWGPAQNLGPVVNTIEDEVTPFLHPVNNTLYFSTKGHLNNFGGFDIVKSRWMGNHWEEPRNLGPLVNTRGDEYYFSLDGRGEKLYYAMARPDNPKDLDLYSFPMPMEARPDAITKLSGYLIDSVSGNPITGIVAAIDRDAGTEIAPLKISPTGYFEFQLVADRRYTLLLLGDNALNIATNVELSTDTVATIFGKALDLSKPVVFRAINFKRNSAEVEKQALDPIAEIAEFLHDYPFVRLTVRGHSDADGDPEFNRQLSLKRAQNIRQLLLEQSGTRDSTVIAEGYGDSRPIRPNDSPANKAINRRVEFEIYVPPAYRRELSEVPLTVATPGTAIEAPKPPPAATPPPPGSLAEDVARAEAAAAAALAKGTAGVPARKPAPAAAAIPAPGSTAAPATSAAAKPAPSRPAARPAATAARGAATSEGPAVPNPVRPVSTAAEPKAMAPVSAKAEGDITDEEEGFDFADEDELDLLGSDLGADELDLDPELEALDDISLDELTETVGELVDEANPEPEAPNPVDYTTDEEDDTGLDADDDTP